MNISMTIHTGLNIYMYRVRNIQVLLNIVVYKSQLNVFVVKIISKNQNIHCCDKR